MAKLICITCPKGCHLTVDELTYEVVGNDCPRGAVYAKNELTFPTRVLTSTVRITGAQTERCPVRTECPVPKAKLFEIMEQIRNVTLTAPVSIGDVVIKNVCDTGVDVIATRSL